MDKKFAGSLFFIMLICASLVLADRPETISIEATEKGILIETPIIEFHKINNSFKFHIHAHNSTDGLLLDNTTTNCIIHIYTPEGGGHIMEDDMGFDSNSIEFEYELGGGNLTENKHQ